MRSERHVAIIGAGQAGARAAAAMRSEGYDGAITLLGDEPDLPYERPPLSKEALFGSEDPLAAVVFDEGYYQAQNVELALGRRVGNIEPASGLILFRDGGSLKADRILLATGARARRVEFEGIDADRLITLRSIADAQRLRPLLAAGRRLVLLGGGFIGLEIAAGAAKLGCSVTVIEARARLIERAVSPAVSSMVRAAHVAHGVVIKTSCTVERVRRGQLDTELQLSDGTTVIADVIVAGVGALANDELAQAAGIACSNGIDVDLDCRTSADKVWAAGDVAARFHSSWNSRMRVESWDNAEVQAARAGRSIAASWSAVDAHCTGNEQPAWFWTDQYDLNLQILGCVTDSDETVTRTDASGAPSLIFHFKGSKLRGAELVSAAKEKPFARKLVHGGWALAPEKLGDMGMSLKQLLNMGREAGGPAS